MPQENVAIRSRTDARTRTPRRYAVVFLNDDFTPMEFVVSVLRSVFFKTKEEANVLMLAVHYRGEATVGIYSYDIAVSKAAKTVALAREEKYPLKAIVREVD